MVAVTWFEIISESTPSTVTRSQAIIETFRTPAVFSVILIIFHIITGISEFVGINAVTNMFLVPFYLALVTLMTWMFLSYTGRAPELAQAIDSAADVVVQKVVTPAIQHIGQRSVQQLVGTERPIRERS
ncbi:hypothetical protein X801_02960 [Opisthorchis viverrini]|uniref:Uncharacterized protein n=1 Tax=Opisthorchis viverrini TaxID=6198 RepID=A0A1S8X374_OPIVI|nr:hypothetical protein X801_02960 [Opisthorchis viverrini]